MDSSSSMTRMREAIAGSILRREPHIFLFSRKRKVLPIKVRCCLQYTISFSGRRRRMLPVRTRLLLLRKQLVDGVDQIRQFKRLGEEGDVALLHVFAGWRIGADHQGRNGCEA